MDITNKFDQGLIQKDSLLTALKTSDISGLIQLVNKELERDPMWTLLDLPIKKLQDEVLVDENV